MAPEGFLHKWGALDFAGGTVVHMSAGFGGAGRRDFAGAAQSHVERETLPGQRPVRDPWHRHALVRLVRFQRGVGAGASRAGRAGVRDDEHGVGRGDARLDLLRLDERPKASALGACIGAVVGLVAITPAAGFVSVAQSIVIGLAASVISNVAAHWRSRSQVDDTLDVFPCHGIGGMVGMVLTGVFAVDVGLVHGSSKIFLVQIATLLIAAPYAFGASWVLYKLTDAIIPLRVSERQELIGLDITQHDETVSSRGVRAAVESMQLDLFAAWGDLAKQSVNVACTRASSRDRGRRFPGD